MGSHVLNTGQGMIYTDRWPAPQVVVAKSGMNCEMAGDPTFLDLTWLKENVRGCISMPEKFEPIVNAVIPVHEMWERVIFIYYRKIVPIVSEEYIFRELTMEDVVGLEGLEPDLQWISNTWGGHAGLAKSGFAWGASLEEKIVSVACSFFVGKQYEAIGVITQSNYRRQGLSTASISKLIGDIVRRGKEPTWTTSLDNEGSLATAKLLGFQEIGRGKLFIVGGSLEEISE